MAVHARVIYGADPVQGNSDLLQLLRDAHATNAAAFPEGRLVATVHSQSPDEVFDVEAEVIWIKDNTWWEYDLTRSVASDESQTPERQRDARMVEAPDELLWYNPSAALMQRIPDRSRGYFDVLRLRPDQVWYCYNRIVDRPWSWFYDPNSAAEVLESLSVAQRGDEITVTRKHTFGTTLTIVASLAAGGNVVRFESEPFTDAPQGVQSAGASGEFSWVPAGKGRFRLQSCVYREFNEGDDPYYVYELAVDEFDPEFEPPSNQFSVAALNLEPGTKIEELGANPRSTQYGQKPDAPTDLDLDRLADELRERGFAAPQRGAKKE